MIRDSARHLEWYLTCRAMIILWQKPYYLHLLSPLILTIHPQKDDVISLKGSESLKFPRVPQDTQLETSSLDLSSTGEACVTSVFTGSLATSLCLPGHPTVALSTRTYIRT